LSGTALGILQISHEANSVLKGILHPRLYRLHPYSNVSHSAWWSISKEHTQAKALRQPKFDYGGPIIQLQKMVSAVLSKVIFTTFQTTFFWSQTSFFVANFVKPSTEDYKL
jgi:hypothetical protein